MEEVFKPVIVIILPPCGFQNKIFCLLCQWSKCLSVRERFSDEDNKDAHSKLFYLLHANSQIRAQCHWLPSLLSRNYNIETNRAGEDEMENSQRTIKYFYERTHEFEMRNSRLLIEIHSRMVRWVWWRNDTLWAMTLSISRLKFDTFDICLHLACNQSKITLLEYCSSGYQWWVTQI